MVGLADLTATILALVAALAAGSALNLGAVLLAPVRDGAANRWHLVALGLSALALVLPFVVDVPKFFRTLLAQALIVQTWRVIEIVRTPSAFGPRERMLRVLLVPYEFTFLTRTERRVPTRDLVASAGLLVAGIALFVLGSWLSPPVAPYAWRGWPRWLGATLGGYLVMEGMTWQWVAVLPIFGWSHRPYQRHPILSRTLAEFWGVRWSSVIHRWLRVNVFEPLARRKAARAGIMASFVVSGSLHAYIVWPSAGLAPAAWMLGFFTAHGAITLVENRLGVRRWRPLAGRGFVIAVFVLTVPLFMEAVLRAIGL
jgi:hypothetical protein